MLGLLGGEPDGDERQVPCEDRNDYDCYYDYYDDEYYTYDYEIDPADPRTEGVTWAVDAIETTSEGLGRRPDRVSLVSATITVTDRDGEQSTASYADRCFDWDDGNEQDCLDDLGRRAPAA